jgi:hypothetical protein
MKNGIQTRSRECLTYRKKSFIKQGAILNEKGDVAKQKESRHETAVFEERSETLLSSLGGTLLKVRITCDNDEGCQSDGLEKFLKSGDHDESVIWESRLASGDCHSTWKGESEEESEIVDYVFQQRLRKLKGEDVRGETLYRDEVTGRMRKLHKDSISIELHGVDSGYDREFGDSSVFRPIMTMKEKLSQSPVN